MSTRREILIIDDDEAVRTSICMYLEDQGYAVRPAADGDIGIKEFGRKRPDCVIVDLRMPGKGGLEVIHDIRAGDDRTPIVVLSGQGQIDHAVAAIRAGACDYIAKPVEDLALVSTRIENALERSRLIESNRRYRNKLEEMVRERTKKLGEKTAELENSLAEKTLLLNEIHHRVKNNLQLINSFISLEENENDPAETHRKIGNLRGRIQAIALVHEILYIEGNFARVSLSDLCNSLVLSLLQSYGKTEISFAIDADESIGYIDINTAVPVGILLNEMISDVLENCFLDGAGKISLVFDPVRDREIGLHYSDDGKPLPKENERDPGSKLRMIIIRALVDQLNGRISFSRERTGNRIDTVLSIQEIEYEEV